MKSIVHEAQCRISYTNIHGCLCSGSSGFVRYDGLSPGTYTLRIVARAANGEREIERRKIHIGRYRMEVPFFSMLLQALFHSVLYSVTVNTI